VSVAEIVPYVKKNSYNSIICTTIVVTIGFQLACTLLVMAGERCQELWFFYLVGLARVVWVGVYMLFLIVMLEGGVVLMEGEACESCGFFYWWSWPGCEWVYMVF